MTGRARLLGHPRIEGGEQPRGQKSWAVLARIALGDRPLTRAELAAELFGEADDPLGALRWCLSDLRRALNDSGLLRGDPLRLAPDDLEVDVWDLLDGTLPAAAVGGTLLDGVDIRNCPSFEVWLLLARGRCAARSMEELHGAALESLAAGDPESAVDPAGRAAALDPLDESAQELFLRTLVAAGHAARASVHLSLCEATFAREGLVPSPALRAAARPPLAAPRAGVRAGVVAASLLRAGTAALDAGSVDAGVETLRRAAEEAERAGDRGMYADVMRTLGSALVHSVRGYDGEGAIVLHQAIAVARDAGNPALTADILRELAFVDIQAGRHSSAERALAEAGVIADAEGDPGLIAGILALRGMNQADLGRHERAIPLFDKSIAAATEAGRARQVAWSSGVQARSLMLSGRVEDAVAATARSIEICTGERWNAFLPWPQAIQAHCQATTGDWTGAHDQAEHAFALACELGDPCWEGMAGRALALAAMQAGDADVAEEWIVDARRRSDRLPDRYVWVSGFVGLAHLEIAARQRPELVLPLAARLYRDSVRTDLPEFIAWALIYQAEAGDEASARLALPFATDLTNPDLHARLAAVTR